MASNLRRSKRTVGKQVTDLDRRVRRLQKNPAPRRLAARAVTSTNLAQNAVTSVELAGSVTTAIVSAQTTADGRNKIFYQTGQPTAAAINDLWFDTDNDYALAKWNGTLWEAFGLGSAAFSYIDAGKITVGTLTGVTLNGTIGNIGGFTLSNRSLYSSYSNVQVEFFSDTTQYQYVDSSISAAFVGGVFSRYAVDGKKAVFGYNGTYVFDTTANGGYSFYRDTDLSVCRRNVGRMWVDHSTDTVGRIRYTSAGTGSFPGLIVSTRAELLFTSGVVYTLDALAAGTTTNKSMSSVDNDYGVWLDGGAGFGTFTRGAGAALVLNQTAAGTGAEVVMRVRRNGADQGLVTVSNSSTNWGVGSDYRLKENVKPVESPISVINSLKPVKFTWKANKDEWSYGFIAHELAETIPYAVHGDKDATHEDGSPNYQQVDYSKLTPILTAGLKAALEKIELLESRISELEK